MSDPWFWILITLVCIGIQSFYSMLEMAIVSFNKVRLQYYVSQGFRRAKWIDHLMRHPARLFGTTLLGVNIALQVGSECSRMVYSSFNLDPDIAPLTQIFLVMIFAELAPMFAARRFAEHVSMIGIPIIYATSKIMTPVIWLIGLIAKGANRLVGGPRELGLRTLSREELQHVVEQHEEQGEFNLLVSNIFNFRGQVARDAMIPLPLVAMLPANATVADVREKVKESNVDALLLYYRQRENVIAMTAPRDLITVPDREHVRPHARPPWFITSSTPLMQILTQFRHNNETVAVVLDRNGHAIGLLTLDDILEEIFGEELSFPLRRVRSRTKPQLIELTFPGEKEIAAFNKEYGADLPLDNSETLAELVSHHLGGSPSQGDTVKIGNFELTVTEATLLGAKTITIKSLR